MEFSEDTGLNYAGARYYDGAVGRFLSQDSAFLAMGDTDQLKLISGKEITVFLADPQELNSYAYARNNPLSYIDPDGNSEINVLLGSWKNVANSAIQWVGWQGFSSTINMGGYGYSLTSSLMNHSLSWYPGSLYITNQNQKNYGNVIDKIQRSSDFKSYVNSSLSKYADNGTINHTFDNTAINGNSVQFNGFNDLALGIHGTYSTTLNGTQNTDGTWNLSVNITDRYDYKNQNSPRGEGGKAATLANNAANVSQNNGVISNYGININFNVSHYNSNKKK
jgi:RHS repeat-associated protein